ncbi:MAG: hypothetical protein ACI89X_004316 [Planctomycetota bacterium]|jgi:hypothetical protein
MREHFRIDPHAGPRRSHTAVERSNANFMRLTWPPTTRMATRHDLPIRLRKFPGALQVVQPARVAIKSLAIPSNTTHQLFCSKKRW